MVEEKVYCSFRRAPPGAGTSGRVQSRYDPLPSEERGLVKREGKEGSQEAPKGGVTKMPGYYRKGSPESWTGEFRVGGAGYASQEDTVTGWD